MKYIILPEGNMNTFKKQAKTNLIDITGAGILAQLKLTKGLIATAIIQCQRKKNEMFYL